MFFAVNLLKQEAHFGDEKEKEKKKTHLLSKDFSLFQGFFVCLCCFI